MADDCFLYRARAARSKAASCARAFEMRRVFVILESCIASTSLFRRTDRHRRGLVRGSGVAHKGSNRLRKFKSPREDRQQLFPRLAEQDDRLRALVAIEQEQCPHP